MMPERLTLPELYEHAKNKDLAKQAGLTKMQRITLFSCIADSIIKARAKGSKGELKINHLETEDLKAIIGWLELVLLEPSIDMASLKFSTKHHIT